MKKWLPKMGDHTHGQKGGNAQQKSFTHHHGFRPPNIT
jgi:hypothetical protein